MRLAERWLSPTLRRLMGAEDVVQDWLSTEAAAGQAVQLVGRFPNTPGVVSRWCGCCAPSTAPHCARVTWCRLSAVRVACWGCRSCFSMPLKPRSRCGRRSSSLQVQRCENARTPSAVPASLLQQVELYKGPKSQDFRRRVETLQHAAEQHRKASAQKGAPVNQPPPKLGLARCRSVPLKENRRCKQPRSLGNTPVRILEYEYLLRLLNPEQQMPTDALTSSLFLIKLSYSPKKIVKFSFWC